MRVDPIGRPVVPFPLKYRVRELSQGKESRVSALRKPTEDAAGDRSLSHIGRLSRDGVVAADHFLQLRAARDVLRRESDAILSVASQLDGNFCAAVETILATDGRVVVTGMGKAGLIGQKLAATLSSTGTPAFALHAGEAVHGDLGCVCRGDVVLCLSNSGETDEVCRLLVTLRETGATLIALTASRLSTLGQNADVVLETGRLREADEHGLAPSTTTTAMLALGDALALVVSGCRGFTPEQFAVFHPGGSLGRKLTRVRDIMRPVETLRVAPATATVRDVFVAVARPGRRTGAVLLVDDDGRLAGLFTDSDLARLLERRRDDQIDDAIAEVMTAEPACVGPDVLLGEVVDLLSDQKLSELPVVDDAGCPLGLIDITDVIGIAPADR